MGSTAFRGDLLGSEFRLRRHQAGLHFCQHGAPWRKATRLVSNAPCFEELSGKCHARNFLCSSTGLRHLVLNGKDPTGVAWTKTCGTVSACFLPENCLLDVKALVEQPAALPPRALPPTRPLRLRQYQVWDYGGQCSSADTTFAKVHPWRVSPTALFLPNGSYDTLLPG